MNTLMMNFMRRNLFLDLFQQIHKLIKNNKNLKKKKKLKRKVSNKTKNQK
jgi:hypothetical protein